MLVFSEFSLCKLVAVSFQLWQQQNCLASKSPAAMRFFTLLLQVCLISHAIALESGQPADRVFQNQLGYCVPLTFEFVAASAMERLWALVQPPSGPLPRRTLRFDLYTRRNPNRRQVLGAHDAPALQQSNFNARLQTRLIIHGWNGHAGTCSNAAIKDAYLAHGDFNLVLVDWSDYALNVNYMSVVLEMSAVGAQINAFARLLHRELGVPFGEMYLVGHSLGAHVAGLAGRQLRPDLYGVIYALNPSGLPQAFLGASWCLAASDATYVESIQTDSIFDYPNADLAHATFFPNWGYGQPHCPNVTTNEPDVFCDHFAALYYFAESVQRTDAFGAWRCKDYENFDRLQCGCGRRRCAAHVFMGGEPATPKRGIYYLSTRPTQPFGYGGQVSMGRRLPQTIFTLN